MAILLLLFGLAIPGPAYAISFAFQKHPEAQMFVRLAFTMLTVILFVGSFLLDFFALQVADAAGASGSGSSSASSYAAAVAVGADVFQHIAMVFPPFALSKGYADIAVKGQCNPLLEQAGLPCNAPSAFRWDLAGGKILYLCLSIPMWMFVVLKLEYRSLGQASGNARNDRTSAAAGASTGGAGTDSGAGAAAAGGRRRGGRMRQLLAKCCKRKAAGGVVAGAAASAAPAETVEDEDVLAQRERIVAAVSATLPLGLQSAGGDAASACDASAITLLSGGGQAVKQGGSSASPTATAASSGSATSAAESGRRPAVAVEVGTAHPADITAVLPEVKAGSDGVTAPAAAPAAAPTLAISIPLPPVSLPSFSLPSLKGLLTHGLRRVFEGEATGAAAKVAVADLSLHVPAGEILGLLGPNGG